MARSAPSLRQASAFSFDPTVTITFEPKALANCIAMVPMPDEPPWMSSVSPDFSAPRSNTLCHTVISVSGMAPASCIDSIAGAGRWRIGAGSLRDVGTVDTCRGNLDQDFARPGRRHRAGLGHKHLRTARPADADHGHLRGQLFHVFSLRAVEWIDG